MIDSEISRLVHNKTVGTFSEIKKVDISLSLTNGNNNFIRRSFDNSYYLYIGEENPESYTILENQLAHILYDSQLTIPTNVLNGITKDIPKPYNLERIASLAARNIFENLENQRVESLWGRDYRGSKVKFWKKNAQKGEKIQSIADPVSALIAARCYRNDLLKNTKYEKALEYIKKIEQREEPNDSISITKQYFDELILPWLKDLYENFQKNNKKEEIENEKPQTKQNKNDNKSEIKNEKQKETSLFIAGIKKLLPTNNNTNKKNTKDISTNNLKSENELKNQDKNFQNTNNQFFKQNKNESRFIIKLNKLEQNLKDLSDNNTEISHRVGRIRRNFTINRKNNKIPISFITRNKVFSLVQELDHTIKDVKLEPLRKDDVKNISREPSTVSVDLPLAKNMEKLFRNVKQQKSKDFCRSGTKFDLSKYIKAQFKTNTPFFIKKKGETRLSVVIGVDCSGSMRTGNKIDAARNLCATLFKSLENIENVNLSVVGWSSSNTQKLLTVTDMEKFQDIKHLTIDQQNALTPTHMAIQYCSEKLSKMKNSKKLLIMLTDGMPAMRNSMDRWESLVYLSREATIQSTKKGITVVGIHVGPSSKTIESYMNSIFCGRFASFQNIAEAKKEMIRVFTKHVISTLR